jgi:hypothetical protein
LIQTFAQKIMITRKITIKNLTKSSLAGRAKYL